MKKFMSMLLAAALILSHTRDLENKGHVISYTIMNP